MADLMLMVGDHPTYEDGDILVAVNDKRIYGVHAGHICLDKSPRRRLRLTVGSLEEDFRRIHAIFKFERISKDEVRRTNQLTLDEEIISKTPNAKGEAMEVDMYIKRRLAHQKHLIFGTEGAEIWYGKSRTVVVSDLNDLWDRIETDTPERKINYGRWHFSPREMTRYLALESDDFSDERGGELTRSLRDTSDPDSDNHFTVKKRENSIDWRNEIASNKISDVLNGNKHVDIRAETANIKPDITPTKKPMPS